MACRTWLITGANRGFGRLMAEKLLARGDRVLGTVRTAAAVDDLARGYPDHFRSAVLDLTEFPEIRPVVDRAFAALGTIHVVVSNAGYTPRSPRQR